MTPPTGKQLTVYSREGCHLCEEALKVLAQHGGGRRFELKVVDIDSDDDLLMRYLERIPVVECEGQVWFTYRVDPARLETLLERVDSI